jgi:hypothetical protein
MPVNWKCVTDKYFGASPGVWAAYLERRESSLGDQKRRRRRHRRKYGR